MTSTLDAMIGISGGNINRVYQGNGFYVSYNPSSRDYGSDTTAIVDESVERFYILNGDHVGGLCHGSTFTFESCMDYFNNNVHLANDKSEHSVEYWQSLQDIYAKLKELGY